MVGTRLKHYDIVAKIGDGGMGVVYRAYDTRLNRHVALKVIRPDALLDADRRGRFLREARTVSAFNHPGIVVVHDVDPDGDPLFLAMELVEGEALDRRLARGALPVREALDYGVQIADALSHAHASDIVHRDLKPANVIVTRDSRVKVLDFGLAKPIGLSALSGTASDANTRTRLDLDTIPGTIVGTVAYMSPEQAEGAPIDARSDIFSFGALLYEMFSGRRAFPSGSVSSTLAAILRDDPAPLRQVAPNVPREVERIVHRCLRKEPALRFQTAADLKLMLADLGHDLDSGALSASGVTTRPHPSSARAWRWSVGALLAAVGVVGVLIASNMTRSNPAALPAETSLEPLTLDGGLTTMPSLSRDGRLLAYASDRRSGNNQDIWVQQLAGGDPLALTDDPADDHSPDFSPDGAQVAFRSERDGGGIYVVPALGGTPRLIAREGRRPRFSPDGARLAYWTGQFRGSPADLASATFVVPLAGGESIRVAREFVVARDPVWAPDGRSLMVYGRRDWGFPDTLGWWWVPLDGSPPVRTGSADSLPPGTFATSSFPVWGTDGVPAAWTEEGVAFSSGANLWLLPVSPTDGRATGSPRRLTLGPGRHSGPTIDRNGNVVFAAIMEERIVERVSLGADRAGASRTVLHTDGADPARTSQTRDGSILVFERPLSGQREIWLKDLRSGRQRIVVRVNTTTEVSATISPDGTRIAYTSAADGADLGGSIFTGTGYVIDTAEGVPRVVCTSCALAGFLSDSRRVLVMTAGQGNLIRMIDVLSGAVFDLVQKSGGRLTRPHASPDDRVLAFRSADERILKSYVVPLTPGRPAARAAWQEVEEPTTSGRPCGWSPDSTILYLLLDTDGFRCLWAQRVDPRTGRLVGRPYVARHLHSAAGPSTSFGNSITSDGFMYDLSSARGNLWRLARAGAVPPK